MANVIFAVCAALVTVAAYLGYTLGCRDTEEEQRQAEIEARQRRIDNARRFAVIVRQGEQL